MTSLDPSFSLYIHLPWCYKKCPYCDFNAYDQHSHQPDFEGYFKALMTDLYRSSLHFPWKKKVSTIYFGGGTPSLAPPQKLAELIAQLKEIYVFQTDIEITLEISPRTDTKMVKEFVNAGITRFSLGLQSFQQTTLLELGREHTADQIIPMLNEIRSHNLRINLDLIYGLEGQSVEEILADLQKAIDTQVEHISWYELTIENNTLFAKQKKKKASDLIIEKAYFEGKKLLEKAGYRQYEVSAWTQNKPCYHNLHYWLFDDYIGLGAGAHSKLRVHKDDIHREHKTRYPKDYIAWPTVKRDLLSDDLLDYLIMRLRLKEPVSPHEIQERLPKKTAHQLIGWLKRLSQQSPELLRLTEEGFALTEKGFHLSSTIVQKILAYTD